MISQVPWFSFTGNLSFSVLKGLGINWMRRFWFVVLLSCSLGCWSFSVLPPSSLWTATHFSARFNFLINFAFSLHACGGVKVGTLHNCFCSLPLFSFTPSDFTEGSRQLQWIITKGRRLKLNPNLTGLLVQELVPIPEVIPFLRNLPRIPSWVFLDPRNLGLGLRVWGWEFLASTLRRWNS